MMFVGFRLREIAIVAALAGLGEELLFRGLLQQLAEGYVNPWWALLISSLAFGAAHWVSTTYAVVTTVVGLYLGWLWMTLDNLLVPILVHGLYDLVALALILSEPTSPSGRSSDSR